MTDRDFVFWLQGFFELRNPGPISKEQAAIIQEHLALVLTKQTTQTMGGWDGKYGLGPDMIEASC